MSQLTPEHIIQVGMGFWPAKALLSGIELGLFSDLGDGAKTGEELARSLGLHGRANPDFFDTLVALRLLERDGEGPAARYRNTPECAAFLDRAKPSYLGGFLEMCNDRLYRYWGRLTEALRTGKPQNEIQDGDENIFAALYSDPKRLEQFIQAMSGISRPNFESFAAKFDFSRYKTHCDVGGAAGALAEAVARRHPHMSVVTADLPPVTAIASKRIAGLGLGDRIRATNVDFFAEPLPKADVITMGMILHDWDLEKKKALIRAAHEALPEGGAFVAIEQLIDDARRENAFGLLMSLNMLVETGSGFDYTGADFDAWCREAGFKRTEVIPLGGPASAAVAYK